MWGRKRGKVCGRKEAGSRVWEAKKQGADLGEGRRKEVGVGKEGRRGSVNTVNKVLVISSVERVEWLQALFCLKYLFPANK